MRDLTRDTRFLSINTATVRKQLALPAIIEACARRGIGAIDPWRDQVQAAGLERIARQVKDAGLALSGYCRGGFFPARGADALRARRDDNRRAVDEAAALGTDVLVLVCGPPLDRDLEGARELVAEGIADLEPYAAEAAGAIASKMPSSASLWRVPSPAMSAA